MKSHDEIKIWSLGADIGEIGKSLSWQTGPIPSFAECDVLIVDTTTLNDSILKSLTFDHAQNLFDEISKRIKTGLTIICIVSKTFTSVIDKAPFPLSNYFWSPFGFWFEEIRTSKPIKPMNKFLFKNYLKKIKELKIALKLKPFWKDRCQSDNSLAKLMANPVTSDHLIQNNVDEIFGGIFYAHDEISSGSMIMLPPLEDSEKAIQAILEEIRVSDEHLASQKTDYTSSHTTQAGRVTDKEKLQAVKDEIGKYRTLESKTISMKELTTILNRISDILSK